MDPDEAEKRRHVELTHKTGWGDKKPQKKKAARVTNPRRYY